ncbi:MAG: hypothetical protein H0U19_11635 [Acidobacteria bacterium]|nr:hypothetical protein [Acidobacteriota bacterium]
MTFGDRLEDLVPRNSFYGDGVRTVNLALAKTFRMPWSGDTISARIEGFNVFNWVQFGYPITDITNQAFGRINGTATQYDPRQVQLVLRYRY